MLDAFLENMFLGAPAYMKPNFACVEGVEQNPLRKEALVKSMGGREGGRKETGKERKEEEEGRRKKGEEKKRKGKPREKERRTKGKTGNNAFRTRNFVS